MTNANHAAIILAATTSAPSTIGQILTAVSEAGLFDGHASVGRISEGVVSDLVQAGFLKVSGWRAGYAVYSTVSF